MVAALFVDDVHDNSLSSADGGKNNDESSASAPLPSGVGPLRCLVDLRTGSWREETAEQDDGEGRFRRFGAGFFFFFTCCKLPSGSSSITR